MRIVVKAPDGWIPGGGGGTSENGKPTINGVSPSWCDVQVFGDNGEQIPLVLVKSIRLEMRESCDPIIATVEMYVESVEIDCEGVAAPALTPSLDLDQLASKLREGIERTLRDPA